MSLTTAPGLQTAIISDADQSIAEQAAHWIVQLSSDCQVERSSARQDFARWKNADPRHAYIAQRMEELLSRVQSIGQQHSQSIKPMQATLQAVAKLDATPKMPRKRASSLRRAASTLAIVCMLVLPSCLLVRSAPDEAMDYFRYLAADISTPTGQWHTSVLADGSRITLSSASAINVHYSAGERVISLVRGEILVDVAKDAQRPFIVATPQGRMRALGTRFVVSRKGDVTSLSMLESRVQVLTANQIADQNSQHSQHSQGGHDNGMQVQAGQRTHITANATSKLEKFDPHSIEDAWQSHQLVVQDQSLPDVLDTLERYRPGSIFYDSEKLGDIRVSAVLPLEDTTQALQLLVNSFPALRVRTLTPYLVRVDVAPDLAAREAPQ